MNHTKHQMDRKNLVQFDLAFQFKQKILEDLKEEFKVTTFPRMDFNQRHVLLLDWGLVNLVEAPPRNTKVWVKKSIDELKKGRKVVLLVPAKLNSKYWRELILPFASKIRFIVNKEGYDNKKKRFTMAIVIFDPLLASQPAFLPHTRKGYQFYET